MAQHGIQGSHLETYEVIAKRGDGGNTELSKKNVSLCANMEICEFMPDIWIYRGYVKLHGLSLVMGPAFLIYVYVQYDWLLPGSYKLRDLPV